MIYSLPSFVKSVRLIASVDYGSHLLLPSHPSTQSLPFITVFYSLLHSNPSVYPLATANRLNTVCTSSFAPIHLQSVYSSTYSTLYTSDFVRRFLERRFSHCFEYFINWILSRTEHTLRITRPPGDHLVRKSTCRRH